MSGDKVLSQAEIDALLSGGSPGEGAASKKAAQPGPPSAPQPTPTPTEASPLGPDAPQLMLDKLVERLETVGAAVERIGQLERAVIESNAAIRQIRQDMQNIANQVQLLSSKVEGILSNLRATIGYRAQKTFTCSSCKTSGNVATRVRCTQCGQENWWGWWPQNK